MKWTDNEEKMLKEHYIENGSNIPELLKIHSKYGIQQRAKILKIKYKSAPHMTWTNEEVSELKSRYEKCGVTDNLLKRHTKAGIYSKAETYGLKMKEKFIHIEVNPELVAILDGLILGDAWVSIWNCKNGMKTGCISITQAKSHKQWLYEIKKLFEKNGLKCSEVMLRNKGGPRMFPEGIRTTQPSYFVKSKSYVDLAIYRDRWYGITGKIIPGDVDVSPISLAQWYMGDGCAIRLSGKYQLAFCTNCFDNNSLNILKLKIYEKYNWNLRQNKHNHLCLYGKKDINDFLDMTAPYKVDCFNYKWGI
jgi:hypothetical protein